MLNRPVAGALQPVLRDALIAHPAGYRLRLAPDVEIALDNAGPVTSFIEGWAPGIVLTLFQPLLLLEFVHVSGRGGYWLLDAQGRFLGNDIARLPRPMLDIVRRRVGPALAWMEMMATPGAPCEPPQTVAGLQALNPDVRRDIAHAALGHRPADAALEPTDTAVDSEGAALRWYEMRPILQNGHPMALGEGWRIAGVRTRLAPMVILELAHRDGSLGTWYVDRQANYLGNSASQLTGPMRGALDRDCTQLFESLWDRVVLAPTLALDPDLAWFMDCSVPARQDLLSVHLSGASDTVAHRWPLTEPPPPALSYTAPVPGGRRVVLDPDHLRALCNQFLRSELFRLVELGAMSWLSPVDGQRIVTPARTLYIDDYCFAYQVHDPAHDLTFYVFGMAGFFRTFAVYFPTADLLVGLDAAHLIEAHTYCDWARRVLLQHLIRYGNDVVFALMAPPGPVAHAFRGRGAIHLGHFVWQDLSGVSYLVDAFPPEALPDFHIFDCQDHPELYGPLEEIFPELTGKVIRHHHSFAAHVGDFYRASQSVIKSTGISVPGQVGRRIVAALRRSTRWAEPVARAAAVAAAQPIVLVGLRIGNRTIEDMQGFAEALIEHLIALLGGLTVVIDGHNSAGDAPGATYASFGDVLTGGSSFLQRERQIAEALTRRFADSPATVIDNIGHTIQESVIWCSEADFFVAPWGAALAKYRWVCNRPGLATVGRWNLQNRSDLAIYHDPSAMEGPTRMLLNAAESATDLAQEAGDRSNYSLDLDMVLAQVSELVTSHVRPRWADGGGHRA